MPKEKTRLRSSVSESNLYLGSRVTTAARIFGPRSSSSSRRTTTYLVRWMGRSTGCALSFACSRDGCLPPSWDPLQHWCS